MALKTGRGRRWIYLVAFLAVGFLLLPIIEPYFYAIRDQLRGHPQGAHGTHPQKFVGLWVREETVMYDYRGQAFYLMPDGKIAGTQGMTFRRWHFDNNTFFLDSWPGCGNAFRGVETTERTAEFSGPDTLLITDKTGATERGVVGKYRRFKITEALKSELGLLRKSENEEESFKARCTVNAIEHYERFRDLHKSSLANR